MTTSRSVIPPALASLVLAVLLSYPGRAQEELGSRLALQVLLSSEDALSWSRYEVDEGARGGVTTEIDTQQLGIRLRVGDHPSRPFVGVFAGRYVEEGGASLAPALEAEFEALTAGVEAGADILLGSATRERGYFFEPRVALGYSWADHGLERETGAGETRLPSAEAEAYTTLVSLGVGRRWERSDRWRVEAGVEAWWLYSEPRNADAAFRRDDASTAHLRLRLAAVFPLRARLAGYGLELATGLVHTELDDEVAVLFGSDRLTELSVGLLARTGDERLPVDAAGLTLRYLDAEAFDGITLGITVSD